MYEYYDSLIFTAMFGPDYLQHEGRPHMGNISRSGRYPYGSGDNPYQREVSLINRYNQLKADGLTNAEICEVLKISSPKELKYAINSAKHEIKLGQIAYAKQLAEDGLGATEIGRAMGISESTIRDWLKTSVEAHNSRARNTYELLKKEVEEKGMIDLSSGAELELGVSRGVLDEAIHMLKEDGYFNATLKVPTTSDFKKRTNTIVVGTDDVTFGYAMNNLDKIKGVKDYYSEDGGETYISSAPEYPSSFDSNRLDIRYGDQGGSDFDGVIELRRDAPDLYMGGSHYSQVRILVDGTHYLKGMAVYSDDLPPGIDIRFNTNKPSGTPKMDTLKPINVDDYDPNNPFGAYFDRKGQTYYIGEDGKEHLSPVNRLKDEGEWKEMTNRLSSQMVSKQPMKFINERLDQTYTEYKARYNELIDIPNPTLRKQMLLDFADECDSGQQNLHSAALPRQRTQVLLPSETLKDNEVFAPNFRNGETLYLIRYPHGSTTEIPKLTVNNDNEECVRRYGRNLADAVAINSTVAKKLSGADFDGDTAVCIPFSKVANISTRDTLKGLVNFDPKTEFPPRKDANGDIISRVMTKDEKQREMGIISNLLTDMQLHGADDGQVERALKQSMVVIDAAKHKLDYKLSEKVYDIESLRKTFQLHYDEDGNIVKTGGASTLISRRKQTIDIPEVKTKRINKDTGEVSYIETHRTYVDPKTGVEKKATSKMPRILIEDPGKLSSGTAQENAYAGYISKLRSMAASARKEALGTKEWSVDPEAKRKYSSEIDSINKKLEISRKNAPRERMADRIARQTVSSKVKEHGLNYHNSEDKKTINKIKKRALEDARAAVGANGKKTRIVLTSKEIEAIQSKAVPKTKMSEIFKRLDKDQLHEIATPKTPRELSAWQKNKIKTLARNGYNNAEIADALRISTSTVSDQLKES